MLQSLPKWAKIVISAFISVIVIVLVVVLAIIPFEVAVYVIVGFWLIALFSMFIYEILFSE